MQILMPETCSLKPLFAKEATKKNPGLRAGAKPCA
jgi:hypothetical protein